jgi:hypothetical protein
MRKLYQLEIGRYFLWGTKKLRYKVVRHDTGVTIVSRAGKEHLFCSSGLVSEVPAWVKLPRLKPRIVVPLGRLENLTRRMLEKRLDARGLWPKDGGLTFTASYKVGRQKTIGRIHLAEHWGGGWDRPYSEWELWRGDKTLRTL